jgi:hypothetical protein
LSALAFSLDRIEFSPNLSAVLGFDETDLTDKLKKMEEIHSNNPSEVRRIKLIAQQAMKMTPIFNLWVYTDIISSCIVGNIEAPLLRVVPVQGEHWNYQCTTFDKIEYLPVSKSSVSSISVYIYTDYGEPVPFNEGKTVVTLSFRRVKSIHTY